MKKIKLIITADDYGIHPVVDDAIIDGIEKGVINSVTVLMNLSRSEAALKKLVKYLQNRNLTKKIGVGIHLNITTGSPLVKQYNSTLVDIKGNFYKVSHYLDNLSKDLLNEVQIAKELAAQVDYFLTIIEDLNVDIPLDHLTSQHNVHLSLEKYAKIVGILSHYYAAHGKHTGKPIPIRRPMPIGKEFGSGRKVSKKVQKLRKDTWRYLKDSNLNINTALFALMNFNKTKFAKIIGSVFSHNGIKCPHLTFLSFFASPDNSNNKILEFQQMLGELYDTSVSDAIIKKGDTLYIEIIHHLGRAYKPNELKQVEKISGFNVDYCTNFRPLESKLVDSIEYQNLLKVPNLTRGNFSDLNK